VARIEIKLSWTPPESLSSLRGNRLAGVGGITGLVPPTGDSRIDGITSPVGEKLVDVGEIGSRVGSLALHLCESASPGSTFHWNAKHALYELLDGTFNVGDDPFMEYPFFQFFCGHYMGDIEIHVGKDTSERDIVIEYLASYALVKMYSTPKDPQEIDWKRVVFEITTGPVDPEKRNELENDSDVWFAFDAEKVLKEFMNRAVPWPTSSKLVYLTPVECRYGFVEGLCKMMGGQD